MKQIPSVPFGELWAVWAVLGHSWPFGLLGPLWAIFVNSWPLGLMKLVRPQNSLSFFTCPPTYPLTYAPKHDVGEQPKWPNWPKMAQMV